MEWIRSSYSGSNGNCVECAVPARGWRKPSYSNPDGNCVEAASDPGVVYVRDSKDPDGPRLAVHAQNYAQFLDRVRGSR